MAAKRAGLRVAYCEQPVQQGRGKGSKFDPRVAAPGWYVHANLQGTWYAYLHLRFFREQDAQIAAVSLAAAGLNSGRLLHEAGPHQVRVIACSNLQW